MSPSVTPRVAWCPKSQSAIDRDEATLLHGVTATNCKWLCVCTVPEMGEDTDALVPVVLNTEENRILLRLLVAS